LASTPSTPLPSPPQAVSGQCEALREDFTATATTLATDLTALAKEAGSLRGDVAAVHTLAQRADADVAAIEARVRDQGPWGGGGGESGGGVRDLLGG
jgi:hypothetical protein